MKMRAYGCPRGGALCVDKSCPRALDLKLCEVLEKRKEGGGESGEGM